MHPSTGCARTCYSLIMANPDARWWRLPVALFIVAAMSIANAQDDQYGNHRRFINEMMVMTYARPVSCSRALTIEDAARAVLYCGIYPYSKNVFEMELEQYASAFSGLTYRRAYDLDLPTGPRPGKLTFSQLAEYDVFFLEGFVIIALSEGR